MPAYGFRERAGRISRVAVGALVGACVGVAGLLAFADAGAMGLGAASVNSGLGEPLRMSFPVAVKPDEEVGCVQVRAKSDDLPAVLNTRTAVIRNGFQTRIEIRSILPVNEPAIGLVVTVGCASPISREYVVFLDPPVIPPTQTAATDASGTLPAGRAERAAPVRRASAPANRSMPRERAPVARKAAPVAQPRAPRTRVPTAAAPAAAPQGSSQPTSKAPKPAIVAPTAKAGDRLTIIPTEPSPPATVPSSASAPVTAAPPSTPPIAAVTPAPEVSTATGAGAAPASPDTNEAAAREQPLRQQQAELQAQLKALGDQIAALKVQTTTLATRNEYLEHTGFTPWLLWLLILLAVIAISVAGWMAWRYTQLRRSIDGAAWWTSNSTGLAPSDDDRVMAAETRGGLVPMDPATRLAPRPTTQTDVRTNMPAPAPQTAAVSNVERSRPMAARPARYPTPIDTDFTVSDIEAAMATVRTVSPPRDTPRPAPIEDSDFAPLGGPTLPSPFTEPPPPMPQASQVPVRTTKVVQRDGDDLGNFVDLEIPGLPASTRLSPSSPSATAMTGRFAHDETEPLDFKLDIPQTFDPLATDSLKTTVIDRSESTTPMDFDLQVTPTTLDFELPSSTQVAPLDGREVDSFGEPPMRHGATALANLFATETEPGIDTILDLDDRHGTPLSTTEVDRLTTTAVEGPNDAFIAPSTRALLARFADLMNQVDEVDGSDPLRAIALLRQYVLRDEKIPTLLWLRLFQLYRKVDKKPVYEALAEHFFRRYQRPMVGWDQQLADRVPQTPLSAMGQVDREIEGLWGQDAGLERIRSLLCDRDQDDAIVFNAVLQRDLLDAAKVFPPGPGSQIG